MAEIPENPFRRNQYDPRCLEYLSSYELPQTGPRVVRQNWIQLLPCVEPHAQVTQLIQRCEALEAENESLRAEAAKKHRRRDEAAKTAAE